MDRIPMETAATEAREPTGTRAVMEIREAMAARADTEIREAISRTGMADTAVSVILILMISLVLAVHIMRFHDLLPSQETAMTYDRQ